MLVVFNKRHPHGAGLLKYPDLREKLFNFKGIRQGEIVANSLADYLVRHPEIETLCTKNGHKSFFTTESEEKFDQKAGIFFGETVRSKHLHLSL